MPIKRPPPKGGFLHGSRYQISDAAICKVNRKDGYSVTANFGFVTCPDCIKGKKAFQKDHGKSIRNVKFSGR